MKTNPARMLLFSVIATLSICLLGAIPNNQVKNYKSNFKQLEQIALNFKDIPHANRTAWNNTAACDPKLLIRLSTSKLVSMPDLDTMNR